MRPPLAAFAESNTIEKIRVPEGAWSRDAIAGGRPRDIRGFALSDGLRKAAGLWLAASLHERSTAVATN
jgi:hypothetical protein